MFEKKAVMFLYAVSPVHMGAGTAIGAIDNPIQRERHTGHPMLAGSGLKGALRDVWPNGNGIPVDVVFGPDTGNASEHAGALSITDGQIVLFPVRSLRQSYVYATCPTALARLGRMLEIAGLPSLPAIPSPGDDIAYLDTEKGKDLLTGGGQGQAQQGGPSAVSDSRLVLETFAFTPRPRPEAGQIAERLVGWLPDTVGDHFKNKLKNHLVVLSDTRFNFFVRNATVVEPHVRIDDETGTADDGGLFYTENVPPEALFASLVMVSQSRKKDASHEAHAILEAVRGKLSNAFVQVGGDATSGRGQMLLSFARNG